MTRKHNDVDRALRRWLWNEGQRWKRPRLSDRDLAKIVVKACRERDRVTSEERAAGKALAEAASAGADAVLITRQSARKARVMLELDWPDVAKLARMSPGVVLGLESGRWTVPHAKALQSFYEAEGLAFTRDGGVAWAQ